MLDLYDELSAATAALEAAGIPYALVGGLAVGMYAAPRATEDIDLFVNAADFPRIAAALAPLGFAQLAGPMRFASGAIEIQRLTKLAPGDFLVIDLLHSSEPAFADLLRDRVALGEAGKRIWVAPVEMLIALKKLRGSKRDQSDIDALEGKGES